MDERGAGLISASFGVLMFIVLLTFAAQVLMNLYTTSVVTGLALDAARGVAERDGTSPAEAEAAFYDRVDGSVDFEIRVEADVVVADLSWETRSVFPAFGDSRIFGVLERTFRVRVEQQQ